MPPHKKKGFRALAAGLIASSLITAAIAGLMGSANIPLAIILPTSAPIWMGLAMMFFMALKG